MARNSQAFQRQAYSSKKRKEMLSVTSIDHHGKTLCLEAKDGLMLEHSLSVSLWLSSAPPLPSSSRASLSPRYSFRCADMWSLSSSMVWPLKPQEAHSHTTSKFSSLFVAIVVTVRDHRRMLHVPSAAPHFDITEHTPKLLIYVTNLCSRINKINK